MSDYGDPILGLGSNSGYGIADISIPGSVGALGGDIPVLPLPSSEIISSILPVATVTNFMPLPTSSSAYTGTFDLSSGSGYSSLTNGLVGIGQSLTAAFITNPKNAATQTGVAQSQAAILEQEALLNAGIQQQQGAASTSSLFMILLLGFGAFIVYKLIER